jgi:hypothetical protein
VLLLLIDLSRLAEVLSLKCLFCLADYLLLLESALFLLVEHPSKLHDLVLLNRSLILKHLSELLFVAFKPLGILLHLESLLSESLDLVTQLLVLTLEQFNLLLLISDLLLESLVGLEVKAHLLLPSSAVASRAFEWKVNDDLGRLLGGVFELVKLLLELFVLRVGKFLGLGKLLHGLLVLLSDGFDLRLEQVEFLVELLAVLLGRLLGVSGGRVLLNDHVMKRLQVVALPVKPALETLLLLLEDDSGLLERVLIAKLEALKLFHVLYSEALDFHLLLADASLAPELYHGLGLLAFGSSVREPLEHVLTLNVPLKQLLGPLEQHALHLQLHVFDEHVLIAELSAIVTLALIAELDLAPLPLSQLSDLLLIALPLRGLNLRHYYLAGGGLRRLERVDHGLVHLHLSLLPQQCLLEIRIKLFILLKQNSLFLVELGLSQAKL